MAAAAGPPGLARAARGDPPRPRIGAPGPRVGRGAFEPEAAACPAALVGYAGAGPGSPDTGRAGDSSLCTGRVGHRSGSGRGTGPGRRAGGPVQPDPACAGVVTGFVVTAWCPCGR